MHEAETDVLPLLLWTALAPCGQTGIAVEPAAASVAEPPPPPSPAPERWLLMKTLQGTWPGALLDGSRLQISGWTDLSLNGSSAADSNLPIGFDFRANSFAVQQNWLRFERAVVTTGTTAPTFGFRSDTILPGIDYRFTLARGVFDAQLTAKNGQPSLYGIDPIQFYGEAYFPTIGRGLDVKLGRMFCQYGVEANDAPSNALFSHSYSFIYDPFTHTGIMGTLKRNDAWSVQAGMILGSDVFIDPADTPTGMGSIKWAPPNGRDSVLFSFIVGSARFDQVHDFHNPDIFDLVFTHKLNPHLVYNFETLFAFTTNVPNIGTATWFGIVNYLTCDITPRLSGTARLEFFDDAQGQRTGFPGLYMALTLGLSFRPIKDITLRPELRYDYNDESRPFEGKHGLFTAATDIILRW